ncbi:hypothetical protein [Bradyrhizobium sp. CB3481]|nr:hypothetical protein [Bradyrhizobium sp. CB3481]WFU14680.1 hypothetical protein QA643_26835 [Bradyrhizobium sp. CB3481]
MVAFLSTEEYIAEGSRLFIINPPGKLNAGADVRAGRYPTPY